MLSAQIRDIVIRSVIMGGIIGMMLIGATGLFAHHVFSEHAEMEKQIQVIHEQIFANTTSRNEALRALKDKSESTKDQIIANQERIITRFDRIISQMLLLEVKQEKSNALIIDMRSRCTK